MSEEHTNANIAEGYYDALCTGQVQMGYSSEGTEQIGVELQIGERAVWSILFWTDKTRDMTVAKLKACGWSGKGSLADQIKGHTVRVGVKYEEYNGKRQMRVNIFDGGGAFKFQNQMDDAAQKGFMASLEEAAAEAAKPAAKGGYPADWDKPGKRQAPAAKGAPPPGDGFSLD